MELILASASPRRAELMAQVGWKCRVEPTDIIEEIAADLPVEQAVAQLALHKALAYPVDQGLIIGADTVVVLEDKILGKPQTPGEAVDMLTALSGRTHRVITGVAVVNAETKQYMAEAEITMVSFRELTRAEITAYVASGEPMDKAGAYGIQGKGALLVQGIEGCYFNVVGLPLVRLARMLQDSGHAEAYRF